MNLKTSENAKEHLEERVLIRCTCPMNVPENKKSAEHDVFSFETQKNSCKEHAHEWKFSKNMRNFWGMTNKPSKMTLDKKFTNNDPIDDLQHDHLKRTSLLFQILKKNFLVVPSGEMISPVGLTAELPRTQAGFTKELHRTESSDFEMIQHTVIVSIL